MGVSVTAYSQVDFIASSRDLSENKQDEIYDNNGTHLYPNYDFPSHSNGLEEGFYYYRDRKAILSMSYGGYNRWREKLCRIIYNVEPNVVWNDDKNLPEYQQYVDKPFYRLIHFSDCEGFLGTKTCIELLLDFTRYSEQIKEQWSEDDLSVPLVDEWIEGLVLASDSGVVVYS